MEWSWVKLSQIGQLQYIVSFTVEERDSIHLSERRDSSGLADERGRQAAEEHQQPREPGEGEKTDCALQSLGENTALWIPSFISVKVFVD